MKVNHVDCSTALKFQWSCIPVSSSSSSDKLNSGSRNVGDSVRNGEAFPRSRFHHAACSVGRYVYISGGKDRYSPLRDLWRFDVITQEWEQIEETKTKIPHLQGHTMLAYKHQLLIFGGTFSDTNEDTPLWVYNTDLNHVHKFCCEPCSLRPVGRREHSAVIYKNNMYIYGGFLDNSGSTDEFWAFSIEDEEWRLIRRHKPGKRHGHVAVVAENRMWLHGGMRGLMALSDLWTFSFGTCTWSKVKGIGMFPSLSNHTAHMVENSIILLGGSKSGTPSQDVWIFRTDTLIWRHISTQTGDLCPPITLHTSVLLNAVLVQNSSTDVAQSVPQLRTKPVVSCDLESVRPWTSPEVKPACMELKAHNAAATQETDILHLEMLCTDLDGNNNDSEDIHSTSETRRLEAETSFCFSNHVKNSDVLVKKQLQNSERMSEASHAYVNFSNHLNKGSEQQHHMGKIQSASDENCADVVPLLARFHSVTSDVDLGENNLTVTLSDEEIFSPLFLDKPVMMQADNYSLSPDWITNCRDGNVSCGRQLPCASFTNVLPKINSVAEKELFDSSLKFSKMKNTKELLIFDPSQNSFNESIEDTAAKLSYKKMNNISKVYNKDAGDNSLKTLQLARHPVDDTFLNSFPRNMFTSCGEARANVSSLCIDHQLGKVIGEAWKDSKFVSDLVVEDLESCDISELFHNVKISYPTKAYLRSSSLKDLYSCVNDLCDHTEMNSSTSGLSKGQLTRSCGNLSCCLNSKLQDQQSLKESEKNNSFSFYKNETFSGRYIKNITSGPGRNSSHFLKPRGNFNKVSHSGKISVATQTTDSQTSLSGPKPNLTSAENSSKFDHFMTHITQDPGAHKLKAAQLEQVKPKPQTAVNSVFKDSSLCILVIGGQTESHSFQKEPLKMWQCCLY